MMQMKRGYSLQSLLTTVFVALITSCGLALAGDCTDTKNAINPVYDANGRIVATTDVNGGRLSYSYDTAGRLSMCTDAKGVQTRFQYDASGNRITVPDVPAPTQAKQ